MNKIKTILILGAGIEQAAAIKIARDIGLRVIAVDGNPNAIGLRLSDVGIVADIKDSEKMIEIGKKYNINGVFTHAVEIPQVVAKVAKVLGLPGLDPQAAERATNKLKRIQCLKEYGINVPKFEYARDLAEAKRKVKKIGFPCVVKPIDNAGARGVKKISHVVELESSFEEVLSYAKQERKVLIEEFLDGKQISTESVIYNGRIITTGFADRNYSRLKEFEPYFVEDGHSVPSTISKEEKSKVAEVVELAIKSLGINWGVAKGDILIKDGKVYIIEMAARTSGGWFCSGTVPIATGINILKPLIKMSVNLPINEECFHPKFEKAACQRYIIPTKDGIFKGIHGVNKAAQMPGVRMLGLFNLPKIGQKIRKATNHSERIGHLIAEGDTLEQAVRRCENAVKLISIEVEDER
ncbi:ATP-grasp domain-containing protein [Hippea jasoniae]|uniref:ATP-grasp domain-containing protein n=1 Tax=Hippea jasoniae TaxID=944479 RepID=UPI000554A6D7|nr:ATP-grasp domain-containing protein [Hippea jasoniae]